MMALAKTEASSSFAAAADFTATESHQATWLQPRFSEGTEASSPAAAAELGSPVCYTSRKRRRTITHPTKSMETRRKTYICGYDDDGATTTTSRSSSRRPESARHASRQYKGKDSLSRLPLRRRRPRSAVRTEYLGVSSVAFAPPLRRYLDSPQHGRHALRSSAPSSTTRRIHSHSGSSGLLVGSEATTAAGSARSSISRSRKERERRGPAAECPNFYVYDDIPSFPTGLSEEQQGFPEGTAGVESRGKVDVLGMHQSPKISSPPGLLTPVGPDWWEGDSPPTSSIVDKHTQIAVETARCEAASDQTTCRAGGGCVDGSVPAHRPSLGEKELPSGVDEAAMGSGNICIGNTDDKKTNHSRKQEQCASGSCGARSCETRQGGQPIKQMLRSGRHRRRTLRSSAWDLLTGRRMERGRRKGSSDIHLPAVSVGRSRTNVGAIPSR